MNSLNIAIMTVSKLLLIFYLNIVLNTVFVPSEWCLGVISPLYKNRGAVNDPDNYRGITLLSCTWKLFTACLNYRLSCYADNVLGKEQACFRVGYSTIDHIFVLQIIIELYQSIKLRVYCAFIDYRKAFGRNCYLMKLMGNCLM